MTFDEFWKALSERNPGLSALDGKMTMSVESFRRSMRQSFDRGEQHGRESAERREQIKDMFGDLFRRHGGQ